MSERNYEFRRRITVVHRPNRRDQTIKPSPEEVLIEDGWSIVIPTNKVNVSIIFQIPGIIEMANFV